MTISQKQGQHTLLDLLVCDQENIKLYNSSKIRKSEYLERTEEITNKLKLYIYEKGFPFKNKESYDVYKAAVTLSLHTDQEFLAYVEKIFDNAELDEVDPYHKAYFVDKLRLCNGKQQLYGTQFRKLPNGSVEFLPIESEFDVDFRRKKIGLPTLEEYKLWAEQG